MIFSTPVSYTHLIARHAYGDVYKSVDLYTTEPGSATLTFVGESGEKKELFPVLYDGMDGVDAYGRAEHEMCIRDR